MALDKENCGQSYLCGRLFAVLEKLQIDTAETPLNRTIKDAYLASAASKPTIVFPRLIVLAQHHLARAKNPDLYNLLIGEIIDKVEGQFPETLSLLDQGRFMIGYYQQFQDFEKDK